MASLFKRTLTSRAARLPQSLARSSCMRWDLEEGIRSRLQPKCNQSQPPKDSLLLHHPPLLHQQHRLYHHSSILRSSTTATSSDTPLPETPQTTTTDNQSATTKTKKKKDDKNLFLDNLGTIFLSVIGLVIAYLVRSYYNSTRRNNLRDTLQEQATLDPLEIDELRRVNPHLTANVFRSLLRAVRNRYGQDPCTYQDFCETIRETLVRHHKVPTIEFGHLLDRIVMNWLERHDVPSTEPQSTTLWMTVLSLAMNAPIPDRIRVLYELLQDEASATTAAEGHVTVDASAATPGVVTLGQVRTLVGYLQDTDQLVIEAQLLPTKNQTYPIQHYHRGTPDELVHWEGKESEPVDVESVASILRSRAVCVWGECYNHKKITF